MPLDLTYGKSCEGCGHLVFPGKELEVTINDKIYHGKCFADAIGQFGSPTQCGICMTTTLSVSPLRASDNSIAYVCKSCIKRWIPNRRHFVLN